MRDNWDFNQSDGKWNIMEGPHGGGAPFRELWAEWDWRGRLSFIGTMLVVASFFALMIYGIYKIKTY